MTKLLLWLQVAFKLTGDPVSLSFLKLLSSRNMLRNKVADGDAEGLRDMLTLYVPSPVSFAN